MTIKQDLQLEQLLNVKCLQNFFVGNKLQSVCLSVVSISYSMSFTNTFTFVFIVNISYLFNILGVLTLYSRLKLIKVSRLGGRNLHSRPF